MTDALPAITIYHNPDCGTSRNVLALIRAAGIEPTVIDYLKTPPARATIVDLAQRIGLPLAELLRRRGTPYAELGLDAPDVDDARRLDAIAAHPILLNRPIVVSPMGVKLCRPSDVVLDILPAWTAGGVAKEEGAPVLRDTAIACDDAGLHAALAADGLPTADLREPGRRFFAYETLDGVAAGYGGFELFGAEALIRSVVVPAEARHAGIGRNLVPLLLFRAYEAGARRAFLLTGSAAPFFGRLGFAAIDRAAAPAAILASREATGLCPASATLMSRTLGF